MRKLTYVVPKRKFFKEGMRGRVTHALGILEGFADDGWDVEIICDRGVKQFEDLFPQNMKVIELNYNNVISSWLMTVLEVIRSKKKTNDYQNHMLMVRYSFSMTPLIAILPLFWRRNETVLEVNSFHFHWKIESSPNIAHIFSIFECFIARRYRHIYFCAVAMTENKLNRLNKQNTFTVTNGVSKLFPPVKNIDHVTKNKHLVYLGSLMGYWDFELLKQCVETIEDKPNISIFGAGPTEEMIRQLFSNGYDITMHGSFDRMTVIENLQCNRDILVLPPKKQSDAAFTGGLSTKLFDYLSYGLPILAPSGTEISEILENKYNCIFYDADNPESFNIAYQELSENIELQKTISYTALKTFKEKAIWKVKMKILVSRVYDK